MKPGSTTISGLFIALLLLAIGCIAIISGPGAQTASAQTPTPSCWTLDSVPSVLTATNQLFSVDAVAANDVWAVGAYATPNYDFKTLIQHWDGAAWSTVPSPSPDKTSTLFGVSAWGRNDVWAVGFSNPGTQFGLSTSLVLHWNGIEWSQIASPSIDTSLNAVSAVSPGDVWAIGNHGGPKGSTAGRIAHWDGISWSIVLRPEVKPTGDDFNGIATVPGSDAWIVGSEPGPNGLKQALILHWDGEQWARMESANPGKDWNSLSGVTAITRDDVWAVGTQCCDVHSNGQTLVEHWDGTSWKVIANPAIGSTSTGLSSVSGTSPGNVWAVGAYANEQHQFLPLIERWDGSAWKVVSSPVDDTYRAILNSVTTFDKAVWAVGSQAPTQQDYRRNSFAISNKNTSAPCAAGTPVPDADPVPTAAATIIPGNPLNPPVPLPGADSRTFPETGKSVSGIFLKYWDEHGGLPQQGYPVSQVLGEISDLDGKMYTVQYFERAVFEYHPENTGGPSEVLLSQLGTFQYKQKYPNAATEQRPNTGTGSLAFPQTNHRLGGRFLDYWQKNGGLAQQGYPISDEFTEVSGLQDEGREGKSYTVQYFERAVFEYHPENQPPYDILLSQLGTFRYVAKYGSVLNTRP